MLSLLLKQNKKCDFANSHSPRGLERIDPLIGPPPPFIIGASSPPPFCLHPSIPPSFPLGGASPSPTRRPSLRLKAVSKRHWPSRKNQSSPTERTAARREVFVFEWFRWVPFCWLSWRAEMSIGRLFISAFFDFFPLPFPSIVLRGD